MSGDLEATLLHTSLSAPSMSISQDLLPVHLARRDIPVTQVSVEKASLMIRPLKALPHVGISTQLSSDGRVKRLALATCDTILLISVDSNAQSWMKMRGTALTELLLGGPVFVGFGIAHIALQIYRDIRAHFGNAVDLSTLCSLSTRETWAPSKLVGTRLWPTTSLSKIDRLWHGGGDEFSEREVALQAWISAMYVGPSLGNPFSLTHNPRLAEPCAMEIAESLQVNTKNLTPKARCFSH
jgi:hypothetical protein